MRILFITAHRLGDAVISTAILHDLQKRYPQARFTIACGPAVVSLFQAVPRCERIIPLVKQRYNRHWLGLWRACVRRRWFMVIDLRSSLVSWGLWARHRVIVRGGRRPGLKIYQHARALGVKDRLMPHVWVRDEERARAKRLLPCASHGGARYWLALAPTAGSPIKAWPPERFVALAKRLKSDGLHPVVFYGPGKVEREQARPVLEALPEAVDMGGDRSLGDVACLLQHCRLFVGNDSGLMHLAAAAGVPTLGLFGPSYVSQYAPSGPYVQTVSAPGEEGKGVMRDLDVDRVFEGAQLLRRLSTVVESDEKGERPCATI